MSKILFALAVMLPYAAHAGEPENKPRPPVAFHPVKHDSCAQFGAGFVKVAGTDTCVKIGGAVSVGAGVTR